MKEETVHPAQGIISLTKCTCNGEVLFGSKIQHENFLKLEISAAEIVKDNYSVHYFPRKHFISVKMSASQFANLLISTNTIGVPCTVDSVNGKYVEKLPKLEPIKVEIEKETNAEIKEIQKKATELYTLIASLKGTVTKNQKEELRNLSVQIHNGINSNLDFLFDTHVKKLEKVGSEIVAEAEARIESMLQNKTQITKPDVNAIDFKGNE